MTAKKPLIRYGSGPGFQEVQLASSDLTDGPSLALDQTSPQTIANGRPILAQGLQLGTSPTVGTFSEGKAYYNATKKTLNVETGVDTTMSLGEQEFCYVYNPGSQIAKGSLVYPIGASGNTPSVALALADAEASSLILGVSYGVIPASGVGMILVRGVVDGIDTHLFSVGETVYLSATVPGGFTNIAPSTTYQSVKVGVILISNAVTGSIYIRPILKNRLSDQEDVIISNPATDQILRYNGLEWVNSAGIAASASKGVSMYYDGTVILATGTNNSNKVESLARVPWTNAEVDENYTILGNSTVLSDVSLFNSAVGRTTLEAGAWTFSTYCGVDLATGVTELLLNLMRVRLGTGTVATTAVDSTHRLATASIGTPFTAALVDIGTIDAASFLQTPQGLYQITTRNSDTAVTILVPATYANEAAAAFKVHKRLFQATTGEINNIINPPDYSSLQLFTTTSVQGAFTILATDGLAIYRLGKTTSNPNRNIYISYGGTTRYSRVDTPLTTVHGDLAGLQGGGGAVPAEEYYHLTAAEHAIAIVAIPDAPSDGSTYGRKNLAWAAIPAGGGNVYGSASVTDGHMAVFDADGYHLKDGGAPGSSTVSVTTPIMGDGSVGNPLALAAATDAVAGYHTSADHILNKFAVEKTHQYTSDGAISIDADHQRVIYSSDIVEGTETILGTKLVFTPTAPNLWGLTWETAVSGAGAATVGAMHKCSGTSASYTLTLPSAASCAFQVIGFRMMPGLTKRVTLTAYGVDLIDGLATRIMRNNEVAILWSDGLNWTKIAGKSIPMTAGLLMFASQNIAAVTWGKIAYDGIGAISANGSTVADMQDATNNRLLILRPGSYNCTVDITFANNSSACSQYVGIGYNDAIWTAVADNTVPANAGVQTRHYNGQATFSSTMTSFSGWGYNTAGSPVPTIVGYTALGIHGSRLELEEIISW